MARSSNWPSRSASAFCWRTILIAAIANFGFKFATVALLGSHALSLRVGAAFALAIAGGWPGGHW